MQNYIQHVGGVLCNSLYPSIKKLLMNTPRLKLMTTKRPTPRNVANPTIIEKPRIADLQFPLQFPRRDNFY